MREVGRLSLLKTSLTAECGYSINIIIIIIINTITTKYIVNRLITTGYMYKQIKLCTSDSLKLLILVYI